MATKSIDSVIVLGAGELGIEVIRGLARHPQRTGVRMAVLLRSSTIDTVEQQKRRDVDEIRSLGFELVPGDIINDSPEKLKSTFARYDTVISCTGMAFPAGTQFKVANAVVSAHVRRYFPWQFGIDYDVVGRGSSQDLFDEQLNVRDLLRSQSTTKWVIVSTGMFITFLFEPAFDVVNAGRSTVTAIGSWENRITVTSPQDIGKLTAELALDCPDIEGVVYTAGDTVSMEQLADIIDIVTGKKVQRELKNVYQLQLELENDPGNVMRKYRVVFAHGSGVAWDKATSFNGQRGISTLTVREWAERHLH